MSEFLCLNCGWSMRLVKGKGQCPRCRTHYDLKIEKPKKRSFRKVAIVGPHDKHTMRIGVGLLLLFLATAIGWNGITYVWQNGLQSFRMDIFTLVFIMAVIGYLLAAGFGKGRKA